MLDWRWIGDVAVKHATLPKVEQPGYVVLSAYFSATTLLVIEFNIVRFV